jgi:putative methionine-R-sulfoxide reductase with GAF domain
MYYECDGRVQSEACLPVFSSAAPSYSLPAPSSSSSEAAAAAAGDVAGIIDAESFTPGAFDCTLEGQAALASRSHAAAIIIAAFFASAIVT